MKHLFTIGLFLLSMVVGVKGQEMTTSTIGNLELNIEKEVAQLINAKIVTTKPRTMPGYRVQIASTASRTEAQDLKTEFLRRYPNVRAYLSYQQPYFKLRVGDFEQRTDASRFMNEIYASFPGFIVNEVINTFYSDIDTAEGRR